MKNLKEIILKKELIEMYNKKKLEQGRRRQILIGVGMIVLCGMFLCLASKGLSVEERDTTPVLLLAPMGLYLIFTKKQIIL